MYRTERGVILLNPSEKGTKYVIELRHKKAITNGGKRKIDKETGRTKHLSKEQLAYRAGYLDARKDSAKAFKAKHPRYKRKTA